MIIGIDLGTTYSVAAYMADDGPQLIPNSLGESLTPSVVGIGGEGELLVGRVAKEFQVLYPTRAVSVFKRYMGTDWKTKIADRDFTAEELSYVRGWLGGKATTIFGGSAEIQSNIISKRILGLPDPLGPSTN